MFIFGGYKGSSNILQIQAVSNVLVNLQWRSQSFKVGRAQSGPLTALIGYLNVLLEYFNFFKFSLAGHNQHLGGPRPCLARPWIRPCEYVAAHNY